MKVAFLGYSKEQTRLIAALEAAGCVVEQTSEPVGNLSGYELVVSFGFKHIIGPAIIASAHRPILNLHISMLPFNRGYHPNFWAHMKETPHGVTIHEIDAGVDTGDLVLQREVHFPSELDTFTATYDVLIEAIEDLFVDNLDLLLEGKYTPSPQTGAGSFHKKAELPGWMTDWSMKISDAKTYFNSERRLGH